MRIVVYPHDLGIGGSQLNAIQLAAAMRQRGHEVVVYGQPGPLIREVDAAGLDFVESPAAHVRPTASIVRHLASLVKARAVDVVHGYEWPPALEALLACRLASRGVAVSTVLSMAVAPFIPRYLPLAVGTAQICEAQQRAGWAHVELLEPPVDVRSNAPGAVEVGDFRNEHGIRPDEFTVSIVSRLAHEMKLEGILSAMDAVAALHREAPAQLVIAGDGPAQRQVLAHAERINSAAGRRIVVCTGALQDPRPAYAVADVGIGMGGSALRSMAFGIPLVVQGEQGFFSTLSPSTARTFLWHGWYGVGPGPEGSAERLVSCLRELRDDAGLRDRLGRFARNLAVERFSVDVVVEGQMGFYARALATRHSPVPAESIRAGTSWAAHTLRRHVGSTFGRAPEDDFNSRPVAVQGLTARHALNREGM